MLNKDNFLNHQDLKQADVKKPETFPYHLSPANDLS